MPPQSKALFGGERSAFRGLNGRENRKRNVARKRVNRGGNAVLTFDLRRRLFWGLVWCLLVLGIMGCQATTRQSTIASPAIERVNAVSPSRSHTAPTPTHTRPRITERTAAPAPDETAEESPARNLDDEHPQVPANPSRLKPGQNRRPTDSQDNEKQHPSKWNERLRAKYA